MRVPSRTLSKSPKKSSAVDRPVGAEESTTLRTGLLDALIEIGCERQVIMDKIRTALLAGDDAEALASARELTGLPSQKSRVSPATK